MQKQRRLARPVTEKYVCIFLKLLRRNEIEMKLWWYWIEIKGIKGENKRKEIARLSKLPNWIYQPPGCYTQTLAFATTTAAIYYYKKHILRSLNPRLLFMYWRRSVKGVAVAKPSAAAKLIVAKPNVDCIRWVNTHRWRQQNFHHGCIQSSSRNKLLAGLQRLYILA